MLSLHFSCKVISPNLQNKGGGGIAPVEPVEEVGQALEGPALAGTGGVDDHHAGRLPELEGETGEFLLDEDCELRFVVAHLGAFEEHVPVDVAVPRILLEGVDNVVDVLNE